MRNIDKINVLIKIVILFITLLINISYASCWKKIDENWYYVKNDNEYDTNALKKYNGETYYLDDEGKMVTNYFLEDYNGETYYFDGEGKMVKDTFVAVDPRLIEDKDDDKDELAYWYYFQSNGKAYKSKNETIKKITIDGKNYIFNEKGQMQKGFISENGSIDFDDEDYPYKDAIYYADIYGVLKKGWMKCGIGTDDDRHDDKDELYLYFDEKNYKKVFAKDDTFVEKIIDGKKYAFDENGVMLSSWDYFDEYHESTSSEIRRYYSDENDGHLVKKGFVEAVPSEYMNEKDYSDETLRTFYFEGNGHMVTGRQKKIGKNYYIFDDSGIMKTGLVLLCDGKYESSIDLDYNSSEMIAKYGTYYSSEEANKEGKISYINLYDNSYSLFYYNDDGIKKTGNIKLDFEDECVVFASDNNNAFSGKRKNKYYSNGILLKGKPDYKYGLATDNDRDAREVYEWKNDGDPNYTIHYYDSAGDLHATRLILIDEKGNKKNKGEYKDKEDYIWKVNENGFVVFDESHIPIDEFQLNFSLE